MTRAKDARQRRILMELQGSPSIRVADLARRLDVSAETIRRDLDALTGRGEIARTYGGAVRRLSAEPGVAERHGVLAAERDAIARAACAELAGARHLLIGSGATTVHVARRIAVEMRDVSVTVHSFGVATVLALNPTVTVTMLPGQYHAGEGAMHGAPALRELERLRADWAVLGASGLSDEGPADALREAGEVYAAMARRAARRMVVADASKIGRAFPACWARWTEIDVLVTDADPPAALAAALRGAGVAIRVAAA